MTSRRPLIAGGAIFILQAGRRDMLVEQSPPALTQALRDEIARHLRTPAPQSPVDEADAETAFRSALAHLETVLGLCLFPRDFAWSAILRNGCVHAPISPVAALIGVSRETEAGAEALDISDFSLETDTVRTRISSRLTVDGRLDFVFAAGFGADWSATPPSLRQAILMLTAHFFDHRHAADDARSRATPLGVEALVRPWRQIRLTAGGR